jgi:hypothetical protein
MLFILLATFIAGIGAAGFIALVYKYILKRPRPKSAIPISAGIAMILLQVVLDYGWFSRATSEFGDDVVVIRKSQGTSLLQPLSFIIPRTDRFLALDKTSLKTNDALPGIKMGILIEIQKDGPSHQILQLFDCPNARRADWSGDMPLSSDVLASKAKWFDLKAGDPLYTAACE